MMSINNSGDNLNIKKDICGLRLKSVIIALRSLSFEDYLKKHFDVDPELTPGKMFLGVILDLLEVVYYCNKNKDVEHVELVEQLIADLQKEEKDKFENCSMGQVFAQLIIKTTQICKAGLELEKIIPTFEFSHFSKIFNEMFPQKIKNYQGNNNMN